MSYSSDILTGGTASADSVGGESSADNANDNNEETFWVTANVVYPHFWKYDLGESVVKRVRKLRIKPHEGGGGVYCKDFTLQGSNNDSDWDVLHTGQHAEDEEWEDYTFSNATSYRYYKVNVTTSWATNYCAIKELEMMELILDIDVHDCTDLEDIMVGG